VTSIAPKYKILQGYEALKPSQLYGEIEVESDKVSAVRVAGDVVKVGQGEIDVP
jgi:predicted PhzF superfamily epimerase YddE/YHI9